MPRILHVTDLHFRVAQFNWVLANAHDYDLVCITGDLLDDNIHQPKTVSEQIKWIEAWVDKLSIPTLICSGNHDLIEDAGLPLSWIKQLKRASVWVDGDIIELHGYQFGCVPYDTDDWQHFKSCDVILSHIPPARLRVSLQQGEDWGNPELRQLLAANQLGATYILCGHIHKPLARFSKFKGRYISNPGQQYTDTPNFNVINLEPRR